MTAQTAGDVTALARPRRARAVPTTVVSTPDEALQDDEWRRMRVIGVFVAALALAGGVAVFLLGGDPDAQMIHWAGNSLVAVAGLWVALTVRDRADYSVRHSALFGIACVCAAVAGFYYWGPLSAVLGVVPFGAFVIASGRALRIAVVLTVVCLAGHATVTLLMIFDVIADRSIVQPVGLDRAGHITALVLVQLICVGAFLIGRTARSSARTAIVGLERAVRALSVREALLVEAKQELERVLAAGGAGRYSEQVVGRFRLGNVIGRGGMGEVYEAEHVASGAEAAVKLLHPHVLADPDHIRRFLREVEIVATLDAPEIVRVLEPAPPDVGLPYLAMERLRGENLADILKREHLMPLPYVVDLVGQVARGLAAAHAAGTVHRDMTPHNLFPAEQPRARPVWKILDFGVCKLMHVETTLTAGRVVGTPAYMAPEQARGEDLDHRADLYSLCVIAYRALTGRPAFAAQVPAVVMAEVVGRMPPRPSQLAELPDDIDVVLAIGLAKSPGDRFTSAGELAAAFAAAADGRASDELRRRARALADRHPWEGLGGDEGSPTR